MIEIDLIKKHGKKALGMSEQGHAPRSWRERAGEILLEIAIIVFAVTLSIWLHSWQEHRHSRARERQFLVGLRQDLGHDIAEMREDSLGYVRESRGMRYLRGLSADTPGADSLKTYLVVLTSAIYFVPNDSRFQGLKSSGSLAILESDTLLSRVLTYYERTTMNLTYNSKAYAEAKNQLTVPFINENLDPKGTNWVQVLQARPMQNVLRRDAAVQQILVFYHGTAQEARALRHAIGEYLKE